MNTHSTSSGYIGRFAPSPSGPLHFGSLVTALGSYLQAKSNQGQWMVRIEDIDPPREVPGASDAILKCLEAHHLFWDGEILYQSQRSAAYNQHLRELNHKGFTYYCQCTRAVLAKLPAGQLCACAAAPHSIHEGAIRFKFQAPTLSFVDKLLGQVEIDNQALAGHFCLKRRDGLFAYQLAVVVDDIHQGITEVARGADLLDATPFQMALYSALQQPTPDFLHFPVVTNESGMKLSKQNHAAEVSAHSVSKNLYHALHFLGLKVPEEICHEQPKVILEWAIRHWDLKHLGQQRSRIDNRIGQADSI